jgi:hypothetical protein
MADLELDGPNSAISVDTLKPKTATTLTLGESGDTIALGSGATSTGFGATYNGAVNWESAIKTADFTAVSGEGYFVNTTSGAITVTLPASPSAGAIVAIKDYAGTFASNNLTIARNSSNIQGAANDSLIETNRASVVLVFADSTKGWLYTNESNVGDNQILPFVAATGGTITTSGDFKIHTFTSSGTFTVTDAGGPGGSNTVDYLVIAGGGGGGSEQGGAGGAGGYRESFPNPATGGTPVSVQGYPITVGAGGAGSASAGPGAQGSSSVFSTITSAGGGLGGGRAYNTGGDGGSGGGAAYLGGSGGSGNTPPVSPPQGNDGGAAPNVAGGGGGGASSAGLNGPGGNGGNGTASSITASSVTRAGGGGGAGSPTDGTTAGAGGPGGGGAGSESGVATAGTANTGGGGGGSASPPAGAAGGSGVVVIRYKFQ